VQSQLLAAGAHHIGRVRDVELVRHETSGGYSGHGDLRFVDIQRSPHFAQRGSGVSVETVNKKCNAS
jgi:hypothetical protein